MKVVLATGNAHKVLEISRVLPANWEVQPQSVFGIEAADETGLTFVENALIKARHASQESGLPAIADDSGLEVDALGGEPGIFSSRYAGADATDADNNAKLLRALDGIPEADRSARFQCVIVLLEHPRDPTPVIATGTLAGQILVSPQGEGGFGYDPLFFVPNLGRSVAELDEGTKDAISHRGVALSDLKTRLALP